LAVGPAPRSALPAPFARLATSAFPPTDRASPAPASQRTAIGAEAQQQGWALEIVANEGLSAATMKRPALTDALERLDCRDADVLVAAKLDRVSRSVADFARLLDLGVDTSTPAGEFVTNTIANTAQYEHRLIGQRTRDGLAAKRAAGVRLGRPSVLPLEVVERIVREHRDGDSLRAIAGRLNDERAPTARNGATWHASSAQSVLNGQAAAVTL